MSNLAERGARNRLLDNLRLLSFVAPLVLDERNAYIVSSLLIVK